MESFMLNLFSKTTEKSEDQEEISTKPFTTQEKNEEKFEEIVKDDVRTSDPLPTSNELQTAVLVVPSENKAEHSSDASKDSDVDKPKKDPDFVPSNSASDDDLTEEEKEQPSVFVKNPPNEDDIEEANTLPCEKVIKKPKPKKMLLSILADESEKSPRRSDRLKQAKINVFLKYRKTRFQTKQSQNKLSTNSK